MSETNPAPPARSASAFWPSILLPLLLLVVFALHLRNLRRFLDFHLQYTPRPPDVVVQAFVGTAGSRPLFHDPHILAYLGLPLFLVTALALYRRTRDRHPRAAAVAFGFTTVGTIYLGGLFGMWTAFYDGLAHLDPSYIDGATATFAAMSAPQGAFLLTTTLAKLSFVGLALQGMLLWGREIRARIAAACIGLGSGLFLAFWDLDNWMAVGSVLLLIGLIAATRAGEGSVTASG